MGPPTGLRAAIALVAFAGCDAAFGLTMVTPIVDAPAPDAVDAAANQVVSGDLRYFVMTIGANDLPMVSDTAPPVGAFDVQVSVLDDARAHVIATPPITRTAAGAFSFATPPGATYLLAVQGNTNQAAERSPFRFRKAEPDAARGVRLRTSRDRDAPTRLLLRWCRGA